MKPTPRKVEILLSLVIALTFSCNGLPFTKKEDKSNNSALAGLAALASSSSQAAAASSSNSRALVMPECGKGLLYR